MLAKISPQTGSKNGGHIQSGTKYNVYWDIFRDYLVTEEVPPIGESYILRQYVNVCIDVYKLFKNKEKLDLNELGKLHPRHRGIRTIDNILRELRSIGLVRKVGDNFQLSHLEIPITEDGFKKYISEKFIRYTPYLKLQKIENKNIGISEIVRTLKDIFRGTSFTEKTWSTYAKYIISWFEFAGLDIKDRLIEIRKGRYVRTGEPQELDFTPNRSPKTDLYIFSTLKHQCKPENFSKIYHSLYDLKSIGLITYFNKTIYLTRKGKLIQKKFGTKGFEETTAIEALKTKRLKHATKYFSEHPSCSKKEFGDALSGFTSNIKSEKYKKTADYMLYIWAKFIYDCLGKEKLNSIANINDI
jgi:hypothetical protein